MSGGGGGGAVGGGGGHIGGAMGSAHSAHVHGGKHAGKPHLTGADEAAMAIFLLNIVNKDIQAAIHSQPKPAGGVA